MSTTRTPSTAGRRSFPAFARRRPLTASLGFAPGWTWSNALLNLTLLVALGRRFAGDVRVRSSAARTPASTATTGSPR
jgi:hypothetical protein